MCTPHAPCGLCGPDPHTHRKDARGAPSHARLQAGHLYDLPVVYRLCAMWFALHADAEANRAFGAAFGSLPTFKFVPLVYQVRVPACARVCV